MGLQVMISIIHFMEVLANRKALVITGKAMR
jgi:hypothetical protein